MISVLMTITLLFGGTILRADDYVSLRETALAEARFGPMRVPAVKLTGRCSFL
jgi:hypothetical protein